MGVDYGVGVGGLEVLGDVLAMHCVVSALRPIGSTAHRPGLAAGSREMSAVTGGREGRGWGEG